MKTLSTALLAEVAQLRNDQFTYGIVIPTIATPEVLLPTLNRLVKYLPTNGERVVIVVAGNPVEANAARWDEEVEPALDDLNYRAEKEGHSLIYSNAQKPIGFGHAVNFGIRLMLHEVGLPEITIIFNDDLRVTPGWLEGIRRAFNPPHLRLMGEPPSHPSETSHFQLTVAGSYRKVGVRPNRQVEDYGRIGIVGPCSVNVAGMQQVKLTDPNAIITEANANDFSQKFRKDNAGEYIAASFLSGFCMALSRECLVDLAEKEEDGEIIGIFNGDQYPIAGYEDNDLCVRAERAGWRLLIDGETFIYHLGHQSFDQFFPEMERGMRNRLRFYEAWRQDTQRPQKIVAVYRLKIETGNDIGLLRASLVGMSRLVDGIAILLTDNPLEAQACEDWEPTLPTFADHDRAWLHACRDPQTGAGSDPAVVAEATRRWVIQTLRAYAAKQGGKEVPAVVRCWDGEFNERDERNAALGLGENLDLGGGARADWLWSVDHDEIPEDRIRRPHVERWITHPDPMVHSWDFGWMNHWDTPRLIRMDSPWGDAVNGQPTYRGGMHGFRLYRVNKADPRRIQAGGFNGLHCGNIPDAALEAKRTAGFRFRHLGYLRFLDRIRKLKRYSKQDPNPDPWLVGGDNYGHLVQEEGAVMVPYVEVNGIGLHMLVYEKENPDDIGRLLDWLYGVVDAVVLVWTGEWAEGDKAWCQNVESPWSLTDWPSTGPSRELAKYAILFKARFIHRPLNNDIAGARNAGISALHAVVPSLGLGWALFVDPDEHLRDPFVDTVALRRMAEVSNGWGWLFQFYNLQPGREAPTLSESLRMSRLDKGRMMVMDGRVHEGFDKATRQITEGGDHPHLRYAPFKMLNLGQKIPDAEMEKKLEKYVALLLLELEENPLSPKAWVSLGLHAENQGDMDKAVICYQRGMLCPGNSYLPFKELAFHHLRMARALLGEVVHRTSRAHGYHSIATEMLGWLQENAPERPLVGLARVDPTSRKGLSFDLPPFPLEQEVLSISLGSEEEAVVDDGELQERAPSGAEESHEEPPGEPMDSPPAGG